MLESKNLLNDFRQIFLTKLKIASETISRKKSLFIAFLLLFIFFLGFCIRLKTINNTYLISPDSFFFERMAKMVLSGNIPEYDALRTNPTPLETDINFLIYLTTYSYKFLNSLFRVDFNRFLFWFPAFIATLSVFPVYIIGRELFNSEVGVLSAFFTTLAPNFLIRTMAGLFDTDGLNILFSAFIIAFFLLSFRYARLKKVKNLAIYAIGAGFFLFLFSLTWNSYWFAFWILSVFFVFYLLYEFIFNKTSKLRLFILSYLIFSFTFLAIAIPVKGTVILKPILLVKEKISMISPHIEGKIFPNHEPSVAEEQPLESLVYLGRHTGEIILILGLFGFLLLGYIIFSYIFNKRNSFLEYFYIKYKNIYPKSFLVLIWFIPLFLGSFSNERFSEYLIFPLSFLAAFFLDFLVYLLIQASSYRGNKNYNELKVIVIMAILFVSSFCLLYPLFSAISANIKNEAFLNEDIIKAMNYLANKTPENSVVATFWGLGYYIESLAQRPTIFDNGTQGSTKSTPVTELGGLDCVKDRGGYIENNNCITSRLQDISITFYTEDEAKAKEILKSYRGDSQEMYYLLDYSLIDHSYWWSYFATWDRQNKDGEHYDAFSFSLVNKKLDEFIMENKVYLKNERILKKGKLVEYENTKESINGFLWVDHEESKIVYIPKELEKSLLFKLLLFDGENSKCFRPEYSNSGIKIFKVIFEECLFMAHSS